MKIKLNTSTLFLLLITFVFLSCSKKEVMKDLPQNLIEYQTTLSTLNNKNIKIDYKLFANPESGLIDFYINIKNSSKQKINFDFALLELVVDNTYSSNPIETQPTESVVSAFSQKQYKITFNPIHNPSFYENYSLNGDFSKNYSINALPIYQKQDDYIFNNIINFNISDEVYNEYKNNYGIDDKIKVFTLNMDSDSFISKQRQHMQENFIALYQDPHSNDEHESEDELDLANEIFILISNTDIYLNQLLIKTSPYILNDDVFLFVKIVNRMQEELIVHLPSIKLKINDKFYSGSFNIEELKNSLTPVNEEFDKDTLIFGRNDRASFVIKYEGVGDLEKIELFPSGFKNYSETEIFASNLYFEQNFDFFD